MVLVPADRGEFRAVQCLGKRGRRRVLRAYRRVHVRGGGDPAAHRGGPDRPAGTDRPAGAARRGVIFERIKQMGKTKDVRAAVEKELEFDPMVESRDIAVRNINGDVTLTGTVPSYPQCLEAAAAGRRVAGVTGLHNHLEVVLPESDFRDDVKLITAANNALAQNVTVPETVEATAADGNITLHGTVASRTEP